MSNMLSTASRATKYEVTPFSRTQASNQAQTGKLLLTLPLGKRPPLRIIVDKRNLLANLLLAGLLMVLTGVSLATGSAATLSGPAMLGALLGHGSALDIFVVHELRLPRVVAGLVTGGAFALAGCLMQTVARNRLATPGIVGLDNGATAFAVASVVGTGISLAPPAMALTGAAVAAALTFGLTGSIGVRGYRFLVAGIGVGAVFGAITQLMLTRVSIDAANAAYPWTVGSLNARPAHAVSILSLALLPALLAAIRLTRSLTVMRLSDTVAISLGVSASRCRLMALSVAVILTGLAVAVAGPVGMVALIGPEFARQISTRNTVPVVGATLAGAIVMLAADLLGRVILAPIEVPVGIVTALIGSPLLLWILLNPNARTTP
ncbi:iron ABC transporter permease [Chromohalobacter nigrandesensis]|nr:iron ABC transporter permease [Chromohalobacter nigrandesensis]MCK0745851.1 iron ABC transporter permease [Chromohalobacter nigrandesensis]